MNGQLQLTDAESAKSGLPFTNWSERARRYIEHLAPGEEFTAEALRRSIGEPEDSNAIGGVVQWASRRHLIAYAGRDLRSARHEARGRFVRIWRRVEWR